LTPPKLPTKDMVQNYENNFSDWESDFLVAAREEGSAATSFVICETQGSSWG